MGGSRSDNINDRDRLAALAREIGERLRLFRLRKKMPQEELALRLGITAQSVSRLERGTMGINLGRLARIAEVLDVPLYRFFMGPREEALDEVGELLRRFERLESNFWPGLAEVIRLLTKLLGSDRLKEEPPEDVDLRPDMPSRLCRASDGRPLAEFRNMMVGAEKPKAGGKKRKP